MSMLSSVHITCLGHIFNFKRLSLFYFRQQEATLKCFHTTAMNLAVPSLP